jgi:biopolymer transport protein ExbD
MKLQRTFNFSPALFAFIPLLNVLFLVLVFWVTGSKFILQPGVQVTMPATSFALGPQRNAEIVTVTAGLAPAIYYRERKVGFTELAGLLAQNKSPDRTLIVKADKNAPSGLIHDIMDESQRRGFSVIWAGEFRQP